MKKNFTITLEAETEEELMLKFEVVEILALTTDTRYLKLVDPLNRKLDADKHRRKRTKEEREQRASFMGFESWKDIAQ